MQMDPHANSAVFAAGPVWLPEIGGAVYEITLRCRNQGRVYFVLVNDLTGSRDSPSQFSSLKRRLY